MDVVGEVLLVIGCGLVLCSSLIWLWSLRPERAPWHGQDVELLQRLDITDDTKDQQYGDDPPDDHPLPVRR
jgi:hypothetical protein